MVIAERSFDVRSVGGVVDNKLRTAAAAAVEAADLYPVDTLAAAGLAAIVVEIRSWTSKLATELIPIAVISAVQSPAPAVAVVAVVAPIAVESALVAVPVASSAVASPGRVVIAAPPSLILEDSEKPSCSMSTQRIRDASRN